MRLEAGIAQYIETYNHNLLEFLRVIELDINKLLALRQLKYDKQLLALRSGYGRQTSATGNCANELGEKCTALEVMKLHNDILIRATKPEPTETALKYSAARTNVEDELATAMNDLNKISEKRTLGLHKISLKRIRGKFFNRKKIGQDVTADFRKLVADAEKSSER